MGKLGSDSWWVQDFFLRWWKSYRIVVDIHVCEYMKKITELYALVGWIAWHMNSLIDKALLTTTKKIVLHVCKFIINLFYLQVVITSHLALKIIFSLVLCKYNITELWFGLFILCLYLIAKSLLTVILSLYLITIYFTLNQVTYKSFLKSFTQ